MTPKKTNQINLCEGPECPQCGSKTTVYARVAEIKEHGEKAVIAGIVCKTKPKPHRYEFSIYIDDILDFEVIK